MTKNFIIYNSLGTILRTGECPEFALQFQASANEFILEGKADPSKDKIDIINKVVLFNAAEATIIENIPVVSTPTPGITVSNQLDLLWIAMHNNETEKVEPFYTAMREAKGL